MQHSVTERKRHLAEIDKIVARWLDGEITVTEKRQLIAEANSFFYGQERTSRATGSPLTHVTVEVEHSHRPPARTHAEPEREDWWNR